MSLAGGVEVGVDAKMQLDLIEPEPEAAAGLQGRWLGDFGEADEAAVVGASS